MPVSIEVKGLKEIRERMRRYPGKYRQEVERTMGAALHALTEAVPPYPPPPAGSTYIRTGQLGRSVGMQSERADIQEVRMTGRATEARWGSNLEYAPFVIGETTQSEHLSHWWTVKTVARNAKGKIERLFNAMVERLARFLDG